MIEDLGADIPAHPLTSNGEARPGLHEADFVLDTNEVFVAPVTMVAGRPAD